MASMLREWADELENETIPTIGCVLVVHYELGRDTATSVFQWPDSGDNITAVDLMTDGIRRVTRYTPDGEDLAPDLDDLDPEEDDGVVH